jgi:hypothetical protein
MNPKRTILAAIAATTIGLASLGAAQAQSYPDKPI